MTASRRFDPERPTLVLCLYRPHAGKDAELDAPLSTHTPLLRELGLITDTSPILAQSSEGWLIEVFEWKSDDSARAAHSHESVTALWKEMGGLCDFLPLEDTEQASTPFFHFQRL